MSCMWYDSNGGRFGTCAEKCPDSSHDCPSNGDVDGCDLWSPFGGRPSVEKTCLTDNKRVTVCEGEGLGSCKRCDDNGKWNSQWMCFLYKIKGLEGCYCHKCTKEIINELESEVNQ